MNDFKINDLLSSFNYSIKLSNIYAQYIIISGVCLLKLFGTFCTSRGRVKNKDKS